MSWRAVKGAVLAGVFLCTGISTLHAQVIIKERIELEPKQEEPAGQVQFFHDGPFDPILHELGGGVRGAEDPGPLE